MRSEVTAAAGEIAADRLEARDRAAELAVRVAELEAELAAARLESRDRAAELAVRSAELAAARIEAGAAADRLAAVTAHSARELAIRTAETQRLARLVHEVTETRRWRALQAVLAPADRLRRKRHAAPPRQLPAPFVVGVPRSGTTLLRLQLDSHSDLAVGPDTGFGVVASRPGADVSGPSDLLDALVALDTWPDLLLDRADAERLLAAVQPWSLGAGLRALFQALAAREGKSRWGDKTPVHSACMPALARALPEARFIHLIRDGRDVAASVRDQPFAPGDGSIEAIARDWEDRIVTARRDAGALVHYREVRYERLVSAPESVLRELCEFIELPFDSGMLRAHERAGAVFARLPERRADAGATATRAERIARHANVMRPPDPARAGRWRAALTPDEAARFEAVAGGLLAELGYETDSTREPSPR